MATNPALLGFSSEPRNTFTKMLGTPLTQTSIMSLPLVARGKVRDIYAVGTDRLLIIATDRLSAFDVVMNEPVGGKGEILNKISNFWFDKLSQLVPNHLTNDDPESVVAPNERSQVYGRAVVAWKLRPLPIESVVRGYIAGSAWSEYDKTGKVCGIELRNNFKEASRLSTPIYTPATKAIAGAHDENISFKQLQATVGADIAADLESISIRLYTAAQDFASQKRLIIADTKFEFGLDRDDRLILMDEALTPDSSRYWLAETYVEGSWPTSLDKQLIRDWLEKFRDNGLPWNKKYPAPSLPANLLKSLTHRYQDVFLRLTQ